MKTYIRKSIKGYYIDFPDEIDATYWAGKIGSTYDDFENNKWILLSDEEVTFHEEYPNASVKEVLDLKLTPMPERTLEDAKIEKITAIELYDNSDAVNSFDVVSNGETIATDWLTPEKRSNYKNSIDAAELVGITELSLYIGEIPVTLPVATAKLMLAQIQLYADQCFIVTKHHESAVEALNTIEAVDTYDVTADYPQKLIFTL